MALIPCPECGRQVSTAATACPACGFPLAARPDAVAAATVIAPPEPIDTETLLMEVRPSWWNFFWHLVFFWLLIPLFIAFYRRYSFVMLIYGDRVTVKEGFWAKDSSEFFIKDIRSIDVRQSVWGRMVGIGDVTISTAATVEASDVAPGVASPDRVRELLISQRQKITRTTME